jgi:GT2 family glycosyltransferase
MTPRDVTVAVPTYERESVLVDTIQALVARGGAGEILVVDQTARHEPGTEECLRDLAGRGRIRWRRLDRPSIPHAMNVALLEATRPLVLFVDDDVEPSDVLVAAHAASYDDAETWAVVGQILQPGEHPAGALRRYRTHGLRSHLDFPFNSVDPAWVSNVVACNFSMRRAQALQVGGFDENFVGAAYRFETEFCRRLLGAGGRVLFQPQAALRHLRVPSGGTRARGSHLNTLSPAHGVGDYYFALRHGVTLESLLYILWRPLRQVRTRFHLRRPWWIPLSLIAEVRAFVLALRLLRRGPRYVVVPQPGS